MEEDQHIGLGHLAGKCGPSERPAERIYRVRVTAGRFGGNHCRGGGDQRHQGENRRETCHLLAEVSVSVSNYVQM